MIKKKFDVTVIGNGAVGCSIAITLAKNNPNLSVALLGNKGRKGAGSLAAGAMLNLFTELDDNCLSTEHARIKFDIGLRAKAIWQDWVDQVNEWAGSDVKIDLGTYLLGNTANTAEQEDRSFNYIKKMLEEYKTPFEIGEPDIKGYNPEELYRARQVIYIPSEGKVESGKLFQAYDKLLSETSNLHSFNTMRVKYRWRTAD